MVHKSTWLSILIFQQQNSLKQHNFILLNKLIWQTFSFSHFLFWHCATTCLMSPSHPVHSCTRASGHDKAGILRLILMPKVIRVMLSRSAQGIWVSLYYLTFSHCPSFDNIMWLHNNSDRKKIRHHTGNPGEAPMELSDLVTLQPVKSGKKQTFEHLGALQSPTHFLTQLPLNRKQSLPWEKFCHLENCIFSKSCTDGNKQIISINKKRCGPKDQNSQQTLSQCLLLVSNNPEACLFDPWL